MNRNLVGDVLAAGGSLAPLLIPADLTGGTGLCNPSVMVRGDRILCNVRLVNYTLWHAENDQVTNNRYGPLVYLNPENDVHLKTKNFLCEIDPKTFTVLNHNLIDTSAKDIEAVWEFWGLEDGRLIELNGRLYLCGVRRDINPDPRPSQQAGSRGGEGRMELSELSVGDDGAVREVSRFRIQVADKASYCEKNWMPILDMPFHFVKWTSPTEIVEVDLAQSRPYEWRPAGVKFEGRELPAAILPTVDAERVILKEQKAEGLPDFRGGSHVVPLGDYRIAVVHSVYHQQNKLRQKDAMYPHRIIVWDRDWNLVKWSDEFLFMAGDIEFCAGAAQYGGSLLVSFGWQDNAAFLLKVPLEFLRSFLGVAL